MNVFGLIIAGGVGARFWPRSRERSPKQLLEIIGNGTMIQNTVKRLDSIVSNENIFIVTNAAQVDEIRRQLPEIPEKNIIVEPIGRNTAPAITLGAEVLKKRYGDGVMVVLPADHLVHDVRAFQETLRNAIQVAIKSKGLVTLGIKPTRPATGFGYIQYDDGMPKNEYRRYGAFPVITFAEKPNLETACRFLESGDFLWNSGMFVWKISTLLNNIAEYLPDLSEEFHRLRAKIDADDFTTALEIAYREMRSISIDYGVMEKAENRYIIPSDFGWNDLGCWDEVYQMSPRDTNGNVFQGNVITIDVEDCHISTIPKRLVAAIGMKDISIIDTEDALLLFPNGRSQEVKEIVDILRAKGKKKFL